MFLGDACAFQATVRITIPNNHEAWGTGPAQKISNDCSWADIFPQTAGKDGLSILEIAGRPEM